MITEDEYKKALETVYAFEQQAMNFADVVKRRQKYKTCSCGTSFTYENKDIQLDPRDGNYVLCPSCGKFINV